MDLKSADVSNVAMRDAVASGMPAELVALALSRGNLNEWDELCDEDLPIPQDLVEFGAYFKFVDRGRVHGFHVHDWFSARREICAQFRDVLASIRMPSLRQSNGGHRDLSSLDAQQSKTIGEADRQKGGSVVSRLDWRHAPSPNDRIEEGSRMSQFVTTHTEQPSQRVERSSVYRDRLAELTDAEREKYRGQLLAVLEKTGEIIAHAKTAEGLRCKVAASAFQGQPWQRVPGPSSNELIELSDLHAEKKE